MTDTTITLRDGAGTSRSMNADQGASGLTPWSQPALGDAPVSKTNPMPIAGVAVVTATFSRPADTTAYASGDLVANSTTAGSVTPMEFTVGRQTDLGATILRARVKVEDAAWKNASLCLHLFRDAPICSVGDNGAFNSSETLQCTEAGYLGVIELTLDKQFAGGTVAVKGIGAPSTGAGINTVPASGQRKIYGLLESRSVLTPASAAAFSVTLEILQS